MPDVFDEIETAPSRDIFDDVSGDVFDQLGESEFNPESLPPRERKRIELGSQFAAGQAENEKLNAKAEDLARQERSITAFSKPVSTLANLPGRAMAAIGGVSDQYQDVYKGGPLLSVSVPQDDPSVLAGVGRVGAKLLNTAFDPDEVLKFVGAANPVGATLMAGQMAGSIPEQVEHAVEVVKDPKSTKADITEAIADPVVTATMSGGIVRGHNKPLRPVQPEFNGRGDPDLIARNIAEPGTVRPQEIQRIGPMPEAAAPEMFEAGNVPFDAMRRFGSKPIPPVDVLPQMGRIENIPILDEVRPKEQLETRGKVSFGAEAPTLLRNAVESAEEIGLSKAARAAKAVATEELAKAKASEPIKAVEPVEAVTESVPIGSKSVVEPAPIKENADISAQARALDSTDKAQEFGFQNRTPEQAKLLRAERDKLQAEFDDVKARMKSAATPQEKMALLDQLSKMNKPKQFLDEALNIAEDKYHDRPLDVEWMKNRLAKETGGGAATEPVAPEGTTRLYRGEDSAAGGGVHWTTDPKYAANQGGKVFYLDLPKGEAEAASQRAKSTGNGTASNHILTPEQTKAAQPADWVKPSEPIPIETENGIVSGSAAEKWADDVLKGGGTHAGPDVIAAYAIKGAAIIERGVRDFAKWSEEMVNKYGPDIKDSLRAIYDQSVAFIEKEKVKKAAPEPTAAPEPSARPASPELKDIYKIFEPEPVKNPSIGERAKQSYEAIRTGLSSKFRPLNKLAEDIAKQYGGEAKDVASIFEQVKGSSGKAEADIYRFNEDMKPVRGAEKDFNAYLFLKRSIDRLTQDFKDIQTAQAGGGVKKLNRRAVGDYTINELESKLKTLEDQIGPEKIAQFEKTADAYQKHLDDALALQVSSGRMSPEVYRAIKEGNQFYAPFKMLKYIEQTTRPDGTGSGIQTLADYTKAMRGIESKDFKLGDMLAAARQNIALSRVLAEKNKAMREVAALSDLDTDGIFIRKLKPGEDAPKGMSDVSLLEDGKTQRYAVNDAVAQSVKFNEKIGGIIPRMAANVFRFGATVANIPFQISNLLADVPRQALVSKFGVQILPDLLLYPFDKFNGRPTNLQKSAMQSLRYPVNLLESIYSSMVGDVVGNKNKLMLDFLDSGAAGTSIQEYLSPDVLRGTTKPEGVAKKVVLSPLRAAMAIEQTSKLTGVKRAMQERGVESAKDLSPEDVTEIRRFSGSPDFGRIGKWTEKYGLNIAEMFLNARIQGAVADIGRLKGRDGARAAAATWINLAGAVGVPTLLLYLKNHETEQDSKAIDSRSDQERKNYWLLPKTNDDGTPKMIKTPQGEVRDYWRIPKRESSKWAANFVEAGMDFARQKDPETFKKWAAGMLEEISPVNISGKTLQERGESVVSGLNPLAKIPIEAATGRDTFRHRNIVPDSMKKASPEQQFTDRTPGIFKELATAMPDVAPEMLRSPLMLENITKNLTAGLITQFLPRKPVEGRSDLENNALLQRFQALPFLDDSDFDERMKSYERESADTQLERFRKAREIADQFKGKSIKGAAPMVKGDPKLAERVVDLWTADRNGITAKERRIIALPSAERARYVFDELKDKTPEEKASIINNLRKKRILTESVAVEFRKLAKPTQ